MISRTVFLLCAGAVSASHYGKPPCQADELAGQLASGAVLCAPKCSGNGTCPTDIPSGATATPQCALKLASGDKYCGLVCKGDAECPTGGQCTKPVPFLPTGVCTYSPGLAAAPLPPASSPQGLFEEFAATVGRIYESAEERTKRFGIFVENLEHIEKMQALDASAIYTHKSVFADWSVDEFSARNTLMPHLLQNAAKVTLANTSDLPDSIDWVAKGAVTPVKNQGQCGSCWSFSATAAIEGANFVKTGQLVSLSEQQLVDCDGTDNGCSGGLPSNAFQFMIDSKTGLEAESNYPYEARGGKCRAAKADELVYVSAWRQIPADEAQMAAALVQYGPLSIGINAGPMQWYGGGVADPWRFMCNPASIDHGVAIVGYGTEPAGVVHASKKFWTIRNSWGTGWGEKGYYRIIRGRNACGLNTLVTTATIGDKGANVVV